MTIFYFSCFRIMFLKKVGPGVSTIPFFRLQNQLIKLLLEEVPIPTQNRPIEIKVCMSELIYVFIINLVPSQFEHNGELYFFLILVSNSNQYIAGMQNAGGQVGARPPPSRFWQIRRRRITTCPPRFSDLATCLYNKIFQQILLRLKIIF